MTPEIFNRVFLHISVSPECDSLLCGDFYSPKSVHVQNSDRLEHYCETNKDLNAYSSGRNKYCLVVMSVNHFRFILPPENEKLLLMPPSCVCACVRVCVCRFNVRNQFPDMSQSSDRTLCHWRGLQRRTQFPTTNNNNNNNTDPHMLTCAVEMTPETLRP
jgi:hypothetical protein